MESRQQDHTPTVATGSTTTAPHRTATMVRIWHRIPTGIFCMAFYFEIFQLGLVWFGVLQGSGPLTPAPLQRAVPATPRRAGLKRTPRRPSGALPTPPGPGRGNSAGSRMRRLRCGRSALRGRERARLCVGICTADRSASSIFPLRCLFCFSLARWATEIGLVDKRVPPGPLAAGGRLTLNT